VSRRRCGGVEPMPALRPSNRSASVCFVMLVMAGGQCSTQSEPANVWQHRSIRPSFESIKVRLAALPPLHWPHLPAVQWPKMRWPAVRWSAIARARRANKPQSNCDDVEEFVRDATSSDSSWRLGVESGGIRVWRRQVEGSSYDEIRGNGLIDAPPALVLALLKRGDAETIREYNPMYDQGHDLQQIDANTKISYGSVRAIFPFKPRDTVTRVAKREVPNLGGTALLLQAVDHPAMPPHPDYVRAKILRGMHLVQPVHQKPGQTNFTFTQQVNAGGVLPAWLMNTLMARDSVVFIQRLEASAKRRSRG